MVWEKGQSGNPHGRPRNAVMDELKKAIKQVEKEQNCRLLVHMVRKAYTSDLVMVALMKKILPDLQQIDTEINPSGGQISLIIQYPNGKQISPKEHAELNNGNNDKAIDNQIANQNNPVIPPTG